VNPKQTAPEADDPVEVGDVRALQVATPQPPPVPALLGETPTEVIAHASEMAKALSDVIEQRKLFSMISGRKYVKVEGWTTLGAMLGVLPREVSCAEREVDGHLEFEATIELVRSRDGAVIGRASAICGRDEPTWKSRPRYALKSMAATRATGKAYRLAWSWIVALAGYEPTPAEEMPHETDAGEDRPRPSPERASAIKEIATLHTRIDKAKAELVALSPKDGERIFDETQKRHGVTHHLKCGDLATLQEILADLKTEWKNAAMRREADQAQGE
jgi:hypothetical protein